MRLATLRTGSGMTAARVVEEGYRLVDATSVGDLLERPDWRGVAERTDGELVACDTELAPVVPRPSKILCVGLNYRSHILEMGRDIPEHPTLFAKFADALIGAGDPIASPAESVAVDWEAELTVVIGATVRRADEREAAGAIAGFTVMNDITMRDWQFRTREWLQGKTFEGTTPLGPVLVTLDELPGGVRPDLAISTTVDGEVVQSSVTSDLVFDPVSLVRYASTITTLRPGDLIATGTPGGVGHARTPARYLRDGELVVTEIDQIGRLSNMVRAS